MTIHSPHLDPYLVKIQEQDEKVYLNLMSEMLKYEDLHIGLAIHQKTPTQILEKMISDNSFEEIDKWILGNPNCPRKLIDSAIQGDSIGHLVFLAGNENLDRTDLSKLIQNRLLAPTLASRERLDVDHFIYLWENYLVDKRDVPYQFDLELFKALLCNPSTPLKILKNLAKYEILDTPKDYVQSLLLSNPALPEEERAEFALLGIKAAKNELLNENTSWYPTNKLFTKHGFPTKYLEILAELGHPSGLLRTDVIPEFDENFDANEIIRNWVSDQSIYQALWPELRESDSWKKSGLEFQYWFSYDESFTYFVCDLDLEHEERQFDGELNYHGISGSPIWLPFKHSDSEAIENFGHIEFEEAIEWGVGDWLRAWALSEMYSNSVRITDEGFDFIKEQDLDYYDQDRLFDAEILESELGPYSWKKLSFEKKEFLLAFIKDVYMKQEDSIFQYAEHFLLCIALNPNTPDDLLKMHLENLNSSIISEALKIRG